MDKWSMLRQRIKYLRDHDVRYSDDIPKDCLLDIELIMDELDRKEKIRHASNEINKDYNSAFLNLSDQDIKDSMDFRRRNLPDRKQHLKNALITCERINENSKI